MWVCLAAALALLGGLITGQAAVTNATQIAAALTLRPLTPQEIVNYGLTNITAYGITNGKAQISAGLSTVAINSFSRRAISASCTSTCCSFSAF